MLYFSVKHYLQYVYVICTVSKEACLFLQNCQVVLHICLIIFKRKKEMVQNSKYLIMLIILKNVWLSETVTFSIQEKVNGKFVCRFFQLLNLFLVLLYKVNNIDLPSQSH